MNPGELPFKASTYPHNNLALFVLGTQCFLAANVVVDLIRVSLNNKMSALYH